MTPKPAPFGFRLREGGTLEPCEAEQRLLGLMQAWRRSGSTSAQIAGLLRYGERVRNPRSGSWFTARDVVRILAGARMRIRRAAACNTSPEIQI